MASSLERSEWAIAGLFELLHEFLHGLSRTFGLLVVKRLELLANVGQLADLAAAESLGVEFALLALFALGLVASALIEIHFGLGEHLLEFVVLDLEFVLHLGDEVLLGRRLLRFLADLENIPVGEREPRDEEGKSGGDRRPARSAASPAGSPA